MHSTLATGETVRIREVAKFDTEIANKDYMKLSF